MGFIKNIISRFDFSMTYFTVFELLLVLLIYPLIKYADPNLFVENGPVENLQLFILLIGMVVCLSGRQNKPLFVFCAFIIIFLMIRETNLGRSYFCAKYLTPTDVCKWQSFKYGYLADWVRFLYAGVIAIYSVYTKVWKTAWLYLTKAPIFVWEFLLMAVGMIGGTLAELASFDSEPAEECFEMLFYISLSYVLWRYSRWQIQS